MRWAPAGSQPAGPCPRPGDRLRLRGGAHRHAGVRRPGQDRRGRTAPGRPRRAPGGRRAGRPTDPPLQRDAGGTGRAGVAGRAGRPAEAGYAGPVGVLGRIAGHADRRAAGRGRAADQGGGVRPGGRRDTDRRRRPGSASRSSSCCSGTTSWCRARTACRCSTPSGPRTRRCTPTPAGTPRSPRSSWTARSVSWPGTSGHYA